MPSDLLSKREAAELLGVHLSTVNRMVSDGRLAPEKVGGDVRVAMYLFRRRDVERLAAKRAKEQAA